MKQKSPTRTSWFVFLMKRKIFLGNEVIRIRCKVSANSITADSGSCYIMKRWGIVCGVTITPYVETKVCPSGTPYQWQTVPRICMKLSIPVLHEKPLSDCEHLENRLSESHFNSGHKWPSAGNLHLSWPIREKVCTADLHTTPYNECVFLIIEMKGTFYLRA
jgi:hypothetical protein